MLIRLAAVQQVCPLCKMPTIPREVKLATANTADLPHPNISRAFAGPS